MITRWTISCALLVTSCFAFAFDARVVSVHDGDTLTVLVGHVQHKIRLVDIDAPELGQPFGRASTDSLKALCAGQDVDVQPKTKDRYGRTVANVTCRQTDAGTHQVRNGMAWVFVKYAPKGSTLYVDQLLAKDSSRGLWADRDPVPPWEWRSKAQAAGR